MTALHLSDFHHYFLGDPARPKLVFLHGLLGNSSNWRTIAKAFESTYHILVYDQRGHGRSVKPPTGYRPENYADDLKLILDELGWTRIHLVGHSMGGRNAMNFAYRYPQYVEALVIEDIGPDGNPQATPKFKRLFQSIPTPFPSKQRAKDFLLNDFSDPVMGQYLYTNLEEKPDGTCDWRFSLAAILETVQEGRERDRWEEIEDLKIPTLIVRGTRTDEFSPQVFERMVSCNKNIQGVEIQDAGHWVHFDAPKEFIAAVTTFFEQVPGQS